MYVIGGDVGTQGARALACDPHGRVVASADEPFPPIESAVPGWLEQDPREWWKALAGCLRSICQQLREAGTGPEAVAGVSVTSTSGTVCLVDGAGEPLGSALMYNDRRASEEADEVNRVGAAMALRLGYRFSSSFALPKLLWLRRHEPERFQAARYLLSPTDFLIGRLCGDYSISDYNNVLKTGYDLLEDKWPEFIAELGIPLERLPRVVAPGTPVGTVTSRAAEETGLAVGTPVLAGTTDGCASQISTGAVAPGQWNSTLGTTLVLKGVTRQLLRDPQGRVYCHRHPDGYWLPGGASNTGGECIARRFPAERLQALNAVALQRAPTDLIAYPLEGIGARQLK